MSEILTKCRPQGWSLHRLGQVFEERKQRASDKNFDALSVTMQGIMPQLETAAKTDDGDNRKLVRKGDYVINSRSDRKGSGGISPYDGTVSLISIVLKPRSAIVPGFAHHLLRSRAFQEEFFRMGHGIVADLWTTRFSEMKNIRFFLPDLPTQKRIAAFLDRETERIDELIGKKERLVEVLKLLRLGRIMQLTAPSDLPVQPLHRLYWVQTGTTPSRADAHNFDSENGMPWATPVDLREDDAIISTKERVSEAGLRGMKPVPKGTVLVNGIGAGVGKIGIAGTRMVFNQQIHGLIPKGAYHHSIYMMYAMVARRSEMLTLANLNTIPILNGERLGRLEIPVPSMENQEKVVSALARMGEDHRSIKSATDISIDRLREYRAALITAAVTGQIDLDTYGKAGKTSAILDRIEEEMQA